MPRYTPRIDALEVKLVLSAANLTLGAYEAARIRIVQVADRLEATGDVAQAGVALGRAVRTIPGGAALVPTLRAEATSRDVSTRVLLGSLDDFIRDRVAAGDIRPGPALRKTLGTPTPTPSPAPAPPAPTPPNPGPPAPPAPTPASLSVNVVNSTISDVYVSFTQVVGGVRTELTGVAVRAGATARFVPVITRNASPITVSFQSPSLGYWQVVAPADFGRLQLAYAGGRGRFLFGP